MFASSLTSAVWPCSQHLCPCVFFWRCPACACQAHLAARLNQFWLWKLPQMSAALNIKRLNSLFVHTCRSVREQQRVRAGVFKITWRTCPRVSRCISSTAPHVCQWRRAFHKEPSVFADPSVLVPPRPRGTDPLTAPHSSSIGSIVLSHIVLLYLWLQDATSCRSGYRVAKRSSSFDDTGLESQSVQEI